MILCEENPTRCLIGLKTLYSNIYSLQRLVRRYFRVVVKIATTNKLAMVCFSTMNNVIKIGVMGAKGSFSEKAGEDYIAAENLTNTEIVPLISAEIVLTAVEDGEIDLGIFPIENSNGGIVIEAVHAMARHRFNIKKMFEFDVHHMLLVAPSTKASEITAVCSHDQALKQCRMYLRRVWPEAEVVPYEDTAKAAEALGNGKLPKSTAVIAPGRCADLYGLEVMEKSIQDLKFNYTSFIVATKE